MFGTPDRYGTTPQDNIFATTPGLEQQARRSQFTINGLLPMFYNSNANLAPVNGPAGINSAEFSPILGASWSTPVFDLPVRFTANVRAEVDRFTQGWQPSVAPAQFDKIALSGRLQYIDPTNDQNFSPYFAYAPRFDFDPFFRERFATRQDLNLGVNKTYNFDGVFQRVAFSANTLADTVWSLGVTAFAQRRFRDPEPSSWAFFLIPSVTYVITEQWNVSLGAELTLRTFDPYLGFNENEWFLEPIATLEFVLPSAWFGSDSNATLFGRPAIDLQMAYEQNWSNIAAFNLRAPGTSAPRSSSAGVSKKTTRGGLSMAPEQTQKLSLFALTTMVVGGMVGAGIFSLPRTFANATGPMGAVIAWLIAGTGMYMLARVFQSLAERKPDLDAGVFAYAKAGFGDYPGFLSAFGYWIGSCIGNVSYWVLIKSTLGAFFPVFGDGNTVVAILVASAGIWLFHFMILRGTQQAAVINSVVTVAKVVPILVFIVLLIFAFKLDLFSANLYGGDLTGQRVRAGAGDDVRHGVRVPRHRGRQRLLALRQGTFRRRQCHHPGLHRRHLADGAGDPAALRGDAAGRHRRHAPALDGDGARGRGRPLGRGLRQHRPAGLGARRLPRLVADLRRGAVHRGQDQGHAGDLRPREQEQGAGRGAVGDQHRRSSSSSSRPTGRATPSP